MKITTGQLLSAYTGKLCCPISELYPVFNFLTTDNLYTHQLPRAFKTCKFWLAELHPWLEDVDRDFIVDKTTALMTVAAMDEAHGKEHEIKPLPAGIWEEKNALEELAEMMAKEKD